MKRFVPLLVLAVVAVLSFGTVASAIKPTDSGDLLPGRDHKKVGSSLEVHINDNGKVLVRGAKVTAVSGGTITAANSWAGISLTWTVKTTDDTLFVRKHGGKSTVADVAVGDFISFSGRFDELASTFTVNADTVKNWSKTAKDVSTKPMTLSGEVSSVAASSQTFVLNPYKGGLVTVAVNATTTYEYQGSAKSFSDVTVGRKVIVTGTKGSADSMLATKVKIVDSF